MNGNNRMSNSGLVSTVPATTVDVDSIIKRLLDSNNKLNDNEI